MQRLNAVICKASTDDKFITAFVALLDPSTGKLESLNAGHNPVYLLRRDGTLEELNNGGVALGMLEMEFPFTTDEVTLAAGDRLFLYSDGLTEAMNEHEVPFGEETVFDLVRSRRSLNAQQLQDTILASVGEYRGTAEQNDDLTSRDREVPDYGELGK